MRRRGGREPHRLREVVIAPGYLDFAEGSCLITWGRTRVLCAATVQETVPPFRLAGGGGWLTAEYAMLPRATHGRQERESRRGGLAGRTQEISRLIGRSLRAAVDLQALGPRTVILDCDVLQADGGTRTASITGAFAALCLALEGLRRQGLLGGPAPDGPGGRGERRGLGVAAAPGPGLRRRLPGRGGRQLRGQRQRRAHRGAAHRRGRALSRRPPSGDAGPGAAGAQRAVPAAGGGPGPVAAPVLVMASRNPGKLRELRQLLQDLELRLLGLDDFPGLPEIPEAGASFAENAATKAREVARLTGLPALADDSGLEVAALGARPGVFSARYAQDRTFPAAPSDADNWRKLLDELRDVPWERRGARFVCEIALALPDGRLFRARGECPGVIALKPEGSQGFGYDPVFWVPDYRATMAQLGPEVKNRISHRARALTALRQILAACREDLVRISERRGVAQPG